jgi:hypothetical protein
MKSLPVQPSILCFVLILAGCGGGSESSGPPLLPSAPAPLPSWWLASSYSSWRADSTVLTATSRHLERPAIHSGVHEPG